MIKEHDVVDFSTPFYKIESTESIKIPLSTILHFPPEKIFLALHKLVGEDIQKGDLIAEHKGMWGTKEYLSEHTGTISEINHHEGSITIDAKTSNQDTKMCYFAGEILEITGESILLKTKSAKEFELEMTSEEFGGPVFTYNEDTRGRTTEEQVADRVICGEEIPPYDQAKLEALGAKAFVTLRPLRDKTPLPYAKLTNIDALEDIIKGGFTYCISGGKPNTICFYVPTAK